MSENEIREEVRRKELHMARYDPDLTFEDRYVIWTHWGLPWWKKVWLAWITGQMDKG